MKNKTTKELKERANQLLLKIDKADAEKRKVIADRERHEALIKGLLFQEQLLVTEIFNLEREQKAVVEEIDSRSKKLQNSYSN